MLGILGNVNDLGDIYIKSLHSLVNAAKCDPHLQSLKASSCSHDDGWGRVLIQAGKKGISVTKYRSLTPIFEEREKVIPNNVDGVIVDIIHARKRSKGMKQNMISTQPIEVLGSDGSIIYVAHNGTLDKQALINMIPLRMPEEIIDKCSDTCLLALYFSQRPSEILSKDLISKLKEITISALNLIIIKLLDNEVEVIFGSYYKRNHDYYKMYLGIYKGNYIIASSTLVDFYKPSEEVEWNVIENGKYDAISIDLENLRVTHKEGI